MTAPWHYAGCMSKLPKRRRGRLKGQKRLPFPIPKTVAAFLRDLRTAVAKMKTQTAVADALRVHQATVCRWVSGSRVPRASMVQALIDNLRKLAA